MSRVYLPRERPVRRDEILRYAAFHGTEPDGELLSRLVRLALDQIKPMACFDIFPVRRTDRGTDPGIGPIASRSLSSLLSGCGECVLLAVTLGLAFDRLVLRQRSLSPYEGWLLHAIGTERVEAAADDTEAMLREEGLILTPRFSPGYGDIPLSVQTDLFRVLDCPRRIGLTLTSSLLMSPAKSVTAFIGVRGSGEALPSASPCSLCSQTDCTFRRD